MSKIFDCFLYNGEDDLLNLRFNYLNSHVDYFVIVESCQTFQAKKKKFVFSKNSKLIQKFNKKIIYLKNNIFANDIHDLKKKIHSQFPSVEINLNKLNYFNKNDLVWYLDSFHREIIIEAIKNKITDNDIFILSDIDEIPSIKLISNGSFSKKKVNVLIQKEFRYFYNTLVSTSWKGTIITCWKLAKFYGLNNLRYLAKKGSNFKYINDGGYHFSSMGPINNIIKKLNQWSHSEFNNYLIKLFINYRYKKGLDIYFMFKHQLKILDLSKNNFDLKMINLIKENFYLKKIPFNKVYFFDSIIYYFTKVLLLFYKIKRKVVT